MLSSMNARTILFAAALLAPLGLGASSQAAYLTGDVSLTGFAVGTSSDDVTTSTGFTFSILEGGTPGQLSLNGGTGDFASIPNPTPVDVTFGFDETVSPYITLQLGAATFVGELLAVNAPGTIANTRAIEIFGTINPGTPAFDATPGRMILTLTQADGPGGSISVSGTIAAQAVPEPASLAMAGMGILGLAGLAARRRLRSSTTA
jgi:hypothetical protein